MKMDYKVKDLMKTDIVVVSPQTKIFEVAKEIINNNADECIVVEEDVIKGIVTLRDLVMATANKSIDGPVFEIMTSQVIVVNENENLIDALKIMRERNIGRLPVVDDRNNLVGILTERYVVRTLPSLLELVYEEAFVKGSEEEMNEENRDEEEFQEGICDICGNYSEFLRKKDGKWLCESCYDEE